MFRTMRLPSNVYISRASCQKGVSTMLLIFTRLNSYSYLVWQMRIISVHTPKCSCLYLCVEQHQYSPFCHNIHPMLMLLDQVSLIKNVDAPFWRNVLNIVCFDVLSYNFLVAYTLRNNDVTLLLSVGSSRSCSHIWHEGITIRGNLVIWTPLGELYQLQENWGW
jgi:hypothetical protein